MGEKVESDNSSSYPLKSNEKFTIIGISASLDKLEPLEQFLRQMVPNSGLAFIVAQNSASSIELFPLEIIAKFTVMDVYSIEGDTEIRPNSVYLLPPSQNIEFHEKKLVLSKMDEENGNVLLANRFMTELANTYGNKAICVLFSMDRDVGAQGIEAINQANGVVMIEESKPRTRSDLSGINYDQVEYMLLPHEMPWHILEYIKFYTNHTKESIEEERERLFVILKQTTGVDFSSYKQASILRRIQRRMGIQGHQSLHEYNQFLNENVAEVAALQKDLLIGVTHFFRDSKAFSVIQKKVIPMIFAQRNEDKQIRVWVAGCSTGEEVYSLAILFREYMDAHKEEYNVKIFATDLDKDSVQHASKGIYTEAIRKHVKSQYVENYFTRRGEDYQVNKEIRQMIIFAQHNLLKDPPFNQLDLVTCRNMLIYLQPEMQRKVISLFHFSLNSNAFLFLGPSETLGKLANLFENIDTKWNIYQYNEMNQWLSPHTYGSSEMLNIKKTNDKSSVISRLKDTDRIQKMDAIYAKLIEDYVGTFIIIDDNNDIIHINGSANKYLCIPKGKPSHSLFRMILESLSITMHTALHKVRKEHTEVIYQDIMVKTINGPLTINLIAKPFHMNSWNEKLIIIFFEEIIKSSDIEISDTGLNQEKREQSFLQIDKSIIQHIKDLDQELFLAKESLQATIEELESSNEEFQASNEELIVVNEEMQSTNEELQSVNEELKAINNEYQHKIQELTEMNNDMSNLIVSSNIATLFLDMNINIRKFNPAITFEINLMDFDIGRPLSDISHNLIYNSLLVDVKQVLFTHVIIEKDIQSKNGKYYSVKILPCRAADQTVVGVVISLVDISEAKKTSEELLMLSHAIHQSPGSIVITDLGQRIKYTNARYMEQTGYQMEEVVNLTLNLFSDNLSAEQLSAIWDQVQAGEKWVGELINKRKNGESYAELVTLLPIKDDDDKIISYLRVSDDITEQKHTLELLYKSDMLSVVGQLAAGIAHEIRNPLTALKGFTKLLAPDTKKKNYIEIMMSELNRIETIISELLMLARPQMLHFEKKNVLDILQDVIMLLEGQAILNNVEIITKFADDLPWIICVQNQLKQVFINIIKNGIEAMPQGGDLIIKARLLESNKILISFTDHGVGIPENKIPQIGDPFYSTKENGTGLGLMVSYKIIENHQGNIEIKSIVGKGTTFEIILNIMEVLA
ncbi:CheR family methyltransferase [Paenibacillus psychroresistens]|nr:CheR family methyltransferase [Paenibacillus psychroresistens]